MSRHTAANVPVPAPHPRTLGWFGVSGLAMGGSNQSLFLIGAVIATQGSAAIPLLAVGLALSLAAVPGWIELGCMYPNRVGGIAATCAEAFRPYSEVLANLTGVCYWWGWVPTCGICAILSGDAIHQWYLPHVPVAILATLIVLAFAMVNLFGVKTAARLAGPMACVAALLALGSTLIPVWAHRVNWHRAASFHLITPFHGMFGALTSAMAGLYLIGFAAPAFEAAACHIGEMRRPERDYPRAMRVSAGVACLYFVVIPVIWLGVFGPAPLQGNLAATIGPVFAPLVGGAARAVAIWFMAINMFHGTLQPLSGASRTLSQLADDALLPRVITWRNRFDAPWVAIGLTAGWAIGFLLAGDPVWMIAAANLTYLIGIALPSIAVWLLRRHEPDRARPYRARRGLVGLGVAAACGWLLATIFGFEQFGLPTVLVGIAFAYSGSVLYAWRKWTDRRRSAGRPRNRSIHLKLTGSMLAVLTLDGAGYLVAVDHLDKGQMALVTVLSDIFVAVALLTIGVGLVLPGMIAHACSDAAEAAHRLATGTLAEFTAAMEALSSGRLDAARASIDVQPLVVHSADEIKLMADSFNIIQDEVSRAVSALDGAREQLRAHRDHLEAAIAERQQLFDLAPDAMIGVARDGTITMANAQAVQAYGYPAGELIGRPVTSLLPEEYRAQVAAEGTSYRSNPRSGPTGREIESAGLRRDGSTFPAEVRLAWLPLEHRTVTICAVRDVSERLAMEAERVAAEHERRQLLARTVAAIEEERTRLAADLHDGPIQRLTALGLTLDRCSLRFERGDTTTGAELLEGLQHQLGAEIAALRRVMAELRPPVLDEGGLPAALKDYAAAFARHTQLNCHLRLELDARLRPDAETVLYRVAQEALTNVAKHAAAAAVWVTLTPADLAGAELTIRDDGRGLAVLPSSNAGLVRAGHYGLAGMRERLHLIGGTLHLDAAPGGGTTVRAWLPAGALEDNPNDTAVPAEGAAR